jgi:hypothetical protein
MDSKANQQNETVVTIEAHCGSIIDLKADESHHQLSEECLTVLAQGTQGYSYVLLQWRWCMAEPEDSQQWLPEDVN